MDKDINSIGVAMRTIAEKGWILSIIRITHSHSLVLKREVLRSKSKGEQ